MHIMFPRQNFSHPAEPQPGREDKQHEQNIQPSPSREDGWWPFGHCLRGWAQVSHISFSADCLVDIPSLLPDVFFVFHCEPLPRPSVYFQHEPPFHACLDWRSDDPELSSRFPNHVLKPKVMQPMAMLRFLYDFYYKKNVQSLQLHHRLRSRQHWLRIVGSAGGRSRRSLWGICLW